MMKVLFTYDYGKEQLDRIRGLGYEVVIINEDTFTELQVPFDADVLCCYNPFERVDINKFTKLINIIKINLFPCQNQVFLEIDAIHSCVVFAQYIAVAK